MAGKGHLNLKSQKKSITNKLLFTFLCVLGFTLLVWVLKSTQKHSCKHYTIMNCHSQPTESANVLLCIYPCGLSGPKQVSQCMNGGLTLNCKRSN